MNFYTLASKSKKSVSKNYQRLLNIHCDEHMLCPDDLDKNTRLQLQEQAMNLELDEFRNTARLGIRMMMEFKKIAEEEGLTNRHNRTYFITIRPDETKISFIEFYKDIQKLVNRKCFINFKLSFEQKGNTMETMGKGFHVHIIAHMTYRSKGEVLEKLYNSVKNYVAYNCFDVRTLYTHEDVKNVEEYITDYKSDDDHKIATKECDELWRKQLTIQHIITCPEEFTYLQRGGILKSLGHCPSSSPVDGQLKTT